MAGLLAVAMGTTSGVILRSFFFFGWPVVAFIVLIGILFLAARLVTSRAAYLLCALFLLAGALGIARLELALAPPPYVFIADSGSKVSYEGVVVDEPDIRDSRQRLTIEVKRGDARTRVLAVAERYPPVAYGDRVRVEGTLAPPVPFDTDTGRIFAYDKYLLRDGIHFIIEFSTIEVIETRHALSFYDSLYQLKDAFNTALSEALPEPSASLASGLILGGKQGLGEELKQSFTVAGLVHIVVLSGYNVMIVAVAVLRLFAVLPRRLSAGLAVVTIGLFVLMAGLGAASVRAGLMAALGLYARATSRTFDALRALLVVGLAMVLWNPLILVFDPGFELSFVATAGLILGAPLVATRLLFIQNEFAREIVATTIAAQVAVLPLLLYQTGLLSVVALPANLLVLPMVPLAMGLSFLAGLITLLAPPLALLAGFPAYAVLSYIIAIARGAAELPFAALSLPVFPFVLVLIAYGALWYGGRRLALRMPTPKGERVVLRTSTS